MATSTIRAGIIGAAGYTGGELLRLLLRHPAVDVAFAQSRSQAGQAVASVHTDLTGDTDLRFSGQWTPSVDVLFLCMGHGQARQWLAENPVAEHIRIIDLSNDFRLKAGRLSNESNREFLYGLPEFQRDAICSAANIANPGCFATAIQLSLLPLSSRAGLGTVHVSGITGSTGAGQALQESVHFTWRSHNIQAYKALAHQHVGEVEETLRTHSPQSAVHFVPYRGGFTRGIYTTAYTACALSLQEARDLYRHYYEHHPFTHICEAPVDLKQVVNTNKCFLYLERQGEYLLIHAVIDNLLKGASGQAVQNMNLMFGVDETTGLLLKGAAF